MTESSMLSLTILHVLITLILIQANHVWSHCIDLVVNIITLVLAHPFFQCLDKKLLPDQYFSQLCQNWKLMSLIGFFQFWALDWTMNRMPQTLFGYWAQVWSLFSPAEVDTMKWNPGRLYLIQWSRWSMYCRRFFGLRMIGLLNAYNWLPLMNTRQ